MLFTLKEIVKWLGLSAFEIWLHLVTLFIFSILVVLKHENVLTASWWAVFSPLFACDGLNTYFCTIVTIRLYKEKDYRVAGVRLLSSSMFLINMFIFKFLLCQKLNGDKPFSYSEIFVPIYVTLQLLMIRACQTH